MVVFLGDGDGEFGWTGGFFLLIVVYISSM